MDKTKMINEIEEIFITKTKEYSDLNELLYAVDNYDSWKMNLVFRSDRIRQIFNENENAITKLKELLNDLDDNTAYELARMIKNLKENEILDASVIILITDKLIEYYTLKNNMNMLISLYMLKALEEMEFFLRMDAKTKDIPLNCYLNVIAYKDRISELDNTAKRNIFIAYYNLIGPLSDLDSETRKKSLSYYKEVREVYKNNDFSECQDEIDEELGYINDVFLTQFGYYLSKNTEIREEYFKFVKELQENDEVDELEINLIDIAKDFFNHTVSLDETIDAGYQLFLKYLGNGITYDSSDDNLNHFCNILDIGEFTIHLLQKSKQNKKINEYLTSIGSVLLNYISSVPYKDHTNYFDDISADLCQLLMPFCKTREEKEGLLNKLVLKRQPITYIHSIMVKEITLRITKAILKYDKNIFKPLFDLGYDTDEKILKYMEKASLYHDLGKCLTVGVINLQSRKLTEREYAYIKLHPSKARVLLDDDSDFDEFYDVMIGHHKYYDGLGGYPSEFDNTKSKYKIAIDLVTISDSIDAATDIYGRNYTKGKNFSTLLEELKQESGTRYNPILVDFISNHKDLIDILDDVTGKNRLVVYYDVYKNIIKDK